MSKKMRAVCFGSYILCLVLPLVSRVAWGEQIPLLKEKTTRTGQVIEYPSGASHISSVLVEAPPGWTTEWHSHPVPVYIYVMEGTLLLEDEDGTRHEYRAGQALLEVINTVHRGSNPGQSPAKLLVVILGVEGKASASPAGQK